LASEYQLRPLLTLSFTEQLLRAHAEFPGFRQWVTATGLGS
jgi:hypothetical protein